jgi:transcriptional regulator with XRE-family HTH domain
MFYTKMYTHVKHRDEINLTTSATSYLMLASHAYMPERLPEEARVSRALRDLIRLSGRTITDVNMAAGMGKGYLHQILRGNQDLKIRHILMVLDAIGVPPREFWDVLSVGQPGLTTARLPDAPLPRTGSGIDWIRERAREEAARDQAELDRRVRAIVREELERGRGGG